MITKTKIIQWLQSVALVIESNKYYLTKLDAANGDADPEINLHRGFQKVLTQLPNVADEDIGSLLKTVNLLVRLKSAD